MHANISAPSRSTSHSLEMPLGVCSSAVAGRFMNDGWTLQEIFSSTPVVRQAMSESTRAEPAPVRTNVPPWSSLSRGTARANNTNHFVSEFNRQLYLKKIVVCSSLAAFPSIYFYAHFGILYKKHWLEMARCA